MAAFAAVTVMGAAVAAEFNLRFASYAPEGDIIDLTLTRFKEDIVERSGGRIEVTVFRNNTLGSNREALELAKIGSVDFVVTGAAHVSRFAPVLGAVSFPFLWKDGDTMMELLNGDIGTQLNEIAAKQADGLKFLIWLDTGFRHVSNNVRPIMEPDDVKGLKLRTLPTPVQLSFWQALGAIPTPMDWSEVMPALQQGVIDGQENPPAVMYPYRVFEVQKFYSLTGHSNEPTTIVMSQATYDRLPPDLQKAVIDSWKEVQPYELQLATEYNTEIMGKLGEVMTINEVPADTLAHFRKVAASIYEEAFSSIGPEGTAIVQDIVKRTH
jgi:tripartite ATP-independent transporter DctP family solute receptor